MRITQKRLEETVETLKEITQDNNYRLSCEYGGYSLHYQINEFGGVQDAFNCGYVSAKELYVGLVCFIQGYKRALKDL